MRIVSFMLMLAVFCGAAGAQNIGDPVPNKQFTSTWNMPALYDELSDFQGAGPGAPSGAPPANKVIILEWFGST